MTIRPLIFLFIAAFALMADGSPDLLVAIRNGDHAQVEKLLHSGADVNTAVATAPPL